MAKPAGTIRWHELEVGNVALEPGNTIEYKTGDWRSQRPVHNKDEERGLKFKDLCIQCGVCYIYCPDSAIVMNEEGYPEFDLDFCKGCGICATECYTVLAGSGVDSGCIKMVDEEEFD